MRTLHTFHPNKGEQQCQGTWAEMHRRACYERKNHPDNELGQGGNRHTSRIYLQMGRTDRLHILQSQGSKLQLGDIVKQFERILQIHNDKSLGQNIHTGLDI